MDSYIVRGGVPLNGNVRIQGSKNAVLPMMAAAVLHNGVTVLRGCPRIADVFFMVEILKCLGAQILWEKENLYIDGSGICASVIPAIYGVQMRSSITLLGSLMGRLGACEMPFPGGCVIGRRPIDLHIQILESMGAIVEEKEGTFKAVCKNQEGFSFSFPKKSVGATENAIMAAVLRKGTSTLSQCATEPEITWLCKLLEKMGAKIHGIGSETLRIEGTTRLCDTAFDVPPDRIVAGTYLLAGAATRGEICLLNPPVEEMGAILLAYEKMGGQYKVKSGKLLADSKEIQWPIEHIETDVYPGLPTDLQSPLLAVLAGIPGASHIKETIFEDRFKIVPQLERMNARIQVRGRDAFVEGAPQLVGSEVYARELRGGAALVVAALSATGTSYIHNCHYIERGYEDICRDITALGGDIKRDKDE